MNKEYIAYLWLLPERLVGRLEVAARMRESIMECQDELISYNT